jgi:hypothetical protein
MIHVGANEGDQVIVADGRGLIAQRVGESFVQPNQAWAAALSSTECSQRINLARSNRLDRRTEVLD